MPRVSPNYDLTVILHGCPPSGELVTPVEKRWMNWLADRLIEEGWNAIAPNLPSPWEPKYEEWKQEFEHFPITSDSLLIGHSCGAAFLVRWLLVQGKSVKKIILVAPAKIPESPDDKRQDLYDFTLPADASVIASERVIIYSNDFPHHRQSLDLYRESLRPTKMIEVHNQVHFLYFQMGTVEFPELFEEVQSGPPDI